jgi:hypothetical protein
MMDILASETGWFCWLDFLAGNAALMAMLPGWLSCLSGWQSSPPILLAFYDGYLFV